MGNRIIIPLPKDFRTFLRYLNKPIGAVVTQARPVACAAISPVGRDATHSYLRSMRKDGHIVIGGAMSTLNGFPSIPSDNRWRAIQLSRTAQQDEADGWWPIMKSTLIVLLTVVLTAISEASDEWMSEHAELSFHDPIVMEEDDEGHWWCKTKLGGRFVVSPSKVGLAEGGAGLYYSVAYPILSEYFSLIFEAPFLLDLDVDMLMSGEIRSGAKYGLGFPTRVKELSATALVFGG